MCERKESGADGSQNNPFGQAGASEILKARPRQKSCPTISLDIFRKASS